MRDDSFCPAADPGSAAALHYRRCACRSAPSRLELVRRAACPSAGLLDRWNQKPNRKGAGFEQPLRAHEHWHVDIAYLNVAGTFYYLCSVLDGFSRAIVHWETREAMKEADVETIIQRGRELYANARPRIISDNGPQFIARDFKEFIRVAGMTHVRTSPYYLRSNGKLERYNRTVKTDSRAKIFVPGFAGVNGAEDADVRAEQPCAVEQEHGRSGRRRVGIKG